MINLSDVKDLGNGYQQAIIRFYNNFDLEYSWGPSEITYKIYNGNYIYNNISNLYDFDSKPWGERDWYKEIITRGYGALPIGKPFNLYYQAP